MTDGTHGLFGTDALVVTALPPLTLSDARSRTDRSADLFPRLGRTACVLAALALPAFGIAFADTVHRAGEPRVSQAAAPIDPSDRAAAPSISRRGEAPR